jgi:hypothetical protein
MSRAQVEAPVRPGAESDHETDAVRVGNQRNEHGTDTMLQARTWESRARV